MSREKRSKVFWKTKYTFPFLIVAMVWLLVFTLAGFYVLSKTMAEFGHSLEYSAAWGVSFMIFQLSFIASIVSLLVCMFIILHRSVGPLPRIEGILEKVINGDYSVRITVREKDTIQSLVDKMNQVIDILEKTGKR